MKIQRYDEVDPFDVYRLTMIAFGFPMTPRRVEHFMKKDPRYLDGFALYAVEEGRAVAQVVPLRTTVGLTSGPEPVGAIAGVCSLPSVWGKGYVRGLMAEAHGLYRDLGLRFSTLMTSRNIRGHGIYRKLGYGDIAPFRRGARRLPAKRSRPTGTRLRQAKMADLPVMQRLFDAHVEDHYGWTARDPRVLRARAEWDGKVIGRYSMVVRSGKVVGYLRRDADEDIMIQEAILPKTPDFSAAVEAAEAGEKEGYATVSGITCLRDSQRYESQGYELYGPSLETVMALPLQPGLSFEETISLFSVADGRFVLYPTDWF